MAVLVPCHLFGISGSWLYGGIQFIGLSIFVFVGIRYIRPAKRFVWYFLLGYPLVIFITNTWVLWDEVFR